MFSISVISVAFAIIISWAFFAMLCSFVHETIVQVKAERGRFMRKYLFKQLQDLPNGVNWASLLYLHGTIDLLSRDPDKPTSEIQPDVFAKTLIEVVGSAHIVQMQLPALQQSLLTPKANEEIQQKQFIYTAQNYFSHATLYNFKAATLLLKPSSVVSMLKQAMNNAELLAGAHSAEQWVTEAKIYEQLVLFIEKWYSGFTERLTYWYKKKTRQRLFLLGCVFGLILNIDSIQLFSFYTENPSVREAVIGYYQQNADTLNQLAKRMQLTNSTNTDSAVHTIAPYLSPGTITDIDSGLAHLRKQNTTPQVPQIIDNATAKAIADSIATVKNGTNTPNKTFTTNDSAITIPIHNTSADTLHMLSNTFIWQLDSLRKEANLPIGYEYSVFKRPVRWFYPFFLKLFGILISGLAASFGGPFWFDVLQRVCTRK